ncbi:hypothetical protein ACVW1B_004717 [Bradyrhizobium sp. USDA 4502]
MKASSLCVAGLAVAIVSIASANAENKRKVITQAAAETHPSGCSVTSSWPNPAPVPCAPRLVQRFHSYNECREFLLKLGHDSWGTSWWCTSQGYKT